MNLDQIHKVELPFGIVKEVRAWKKACDEIKNSPLAHLKAHDNEGTRTNHYQTSVPISLIEPSYWLPFTLRLCAQLYGGSHRNYYLRKNEGHFDGYDLWINYSYKGNSNPEHWHLGCLSGVIFLKNKDETIFTKSNVKVVGKPGEMLLFPSDTMHMVKPQKKNYERITFAFNIHRKNLS